MPFDFNLKRDEINDAHGSVILPLTDVTMTKLALGDATNNIGQADTYYTDNSVNSSNSDMFTNYAVNNFSIPINEDSSYFTNTFAGNPMPLKDNTSDNAFHGTCKPVSLGDYIGNSSLGSNLDGSFATAGISAGDVYVSVFKTDTTPNPMAPVWQCNASCGLGSLSTLTANDSDVRLFAYPGLDINSNQKAIVVIVNDFGNSLLHVFMFSWDHSTNTLALMTSANVGSTSADNIKYTGQHDIFYIPNSKKLLLLRKDNQLEEFYIDPPALTLTAVTAISSITAVAVDGANGIIATTDTSGDLTTYTSGSLLSTPNVNTGFVLPTVFDGCYYNNGVDPLGFYFCAYDGTNSEIASYRFEIDGLGNVVASNDYATKGITVSNWTQVEVPYYNVLNIGVGPDNTSLVPTTRVVCDATTLRPTDDGYNNSDVEDFILMRHPVGNNSINGNSAGGSGHLICVDDDSTIITCSNSFLNEVETSQYSSVFSAKHQYIIYLGRCYNSLTSQDNYLYLALASNIAASYDPSGSSTGGYYLYFNYN